MSDALFQLCNRSLRIEAVPAIDLTEYVISKVAGCMLLRIFFYSVFPPPPISTQELAKAGKSWKDDVAVRPASTPFALKSAMVNRPSALSARRRIRGPFVNCRVFSYLHKPFRFNPLII
jgi:hypothetical protein